MSDHGRAHILLLPYPAQGHMIPIIDFTHRLVAAADGGVIRRRLTVTVIVTPKNLPFLRPLLAANPAAVSALVLPFPLHPDIPDGVENLAHLPPSACPSLMHALGQLRDPLLDWLLRHNSPPDAIVADMFIGWAHTLAKEIGVPSYAFYPSGAFSVAISHFLWTEMPCRRDGSNEDELVALEKIPGSPVYPWRHLSAMYRSYVCGESVSEFIKDSFRANAESDGHVFNTFDELERVYLDHLMNVLGPNRVWSIGPVHPIKGMDPTDRGGPNVVVSESEISSWLDTCGDRTVVYVCFGSQHVLTNQQMEGLTRALETSGVKFVLVEGDRGTIPPGFDARVAERGFVIRGWAPQIVILRHKAVAAFLTHTGWNSIVESLVSGVPMMVWPMSADQFVNTTLLVDQLGVAVRVCMGDEAKVDAIELACILADATSDNWEGRRARAAALSTAALAAIKEGGSSFNNLNSFMRDLCGEIY